MLQQTSLLAFHDLKDVNAKQRACYSAIKRLGSACNQDIAVDLNWEINRVTPRVKELRGKNLVEEAYREVNPRTNRTCIYWRTCESI